MVNGGCIGVWLKSFEDMFGRLNVICCMCSTKHLGDLVLGFGRQKARRRKRKRHSKPLTCPGIWVFWAGSTKPSSLTRKKSLWPYWFIFWVINHDYLTTSFSIWLSTSNKYWCIRGVIFYYSGKLGYKSVYSVQTTVVFLYTGRSFEVKSGFEEFWRLTNTTFFTNNRLKQETHVFQTSQTEMVCLFQRVQSILGFSQNIWLYDIMC